MGSIPFATDVLGVLDKLETVVTNLVERRDISQDNRESLRRLHQLYEDATEELQRYTASPDTDSVLTKRLDHFNTRLQQNVEKLQAWQMKVEKATILSRVRRMKQILDKCEADANDFFQFVVEHVSPAAKEGDNVQPAKYTPDNNVPRNPPRLSLDYDNPKTCEGKLKAAVLDRNSVGVIAVVASGKGGVGKTCALRGLAIDPDIRNRFPGGTLYIQLGNDSNVSTVIQGITRIVRRTRGASLAKRFVYVRHLQDASDEASVWFRSYTCLLLVDDIWWENGIDIEVLNVLCTMLNDDSRVVFTSRDRRFLSGTDSVIEFSEAGARSQLARRMLMTHAGYEKDGVLDEANNAALEAILDICQGLPLALGIAGASVRNTLHMKNADEKQAAWSDFYEDIMSKRKDLFDISSGKDKLPKIVDISLEVLENRKDGRGYQRHFRALCVVKKQQMVPVHMLQRLWDLKDLREAEKVVESFSDVSIVQARKEDGCIWIQLHDLILNIATRRAYQEYETQQFFRTLVHNYAPKDERENVSEAEGESGEEQAIRIGIRKRNNIIPTLKRFCCMARQIMDIGEFETTRVSRLHSSLFREWWSFEDDGYVYGNICRGLELAGNADELMWLLSKPQWIVKRLQTSGIYGVQQDIEQGKSVVRGKGTNESSILRHLEMVEKAARMSCTFVKDNPYEAWFQLYGRLVLYAKQCQRTQRFIDEIERCAPRPWARPSERFLQPALGAGIDLINCAGAVLCVSEDDGNVVFVWQGGNEAACVAQYNPKTGLRNARELRVEEGMHNGMTVCAAFSRDMKRLATGHTNGRIVIWDRHTGSIRRIFEGHTGRVRSVAFSADGIRVVSGSADGSVRIWYALSGEAARQPLDGHTDSVCCVAFSTDGSLVVSGSDDRTIRLWDALSGEAKGQPLVGHTDSVHCVALSSDGSRVVSGSDDRTIRLWDTLTGEAIGQPLIGHADGVPCVAFSEDGSLVVSGSSDRTIRLWDTRTGEAIVQPLVGHTDHVRYVVFSEDGSRVVSGSEDHTVRLWDVLSRDVVGQPFVGHTDYVRCLAFNEEGSQVVTGSGNGKVRLWNILSGEAVGQPLEVGHTRPVYCVAFSVDGSRVVSGSDDHTLRLWDTLSGKAVGQPLVGHKARVKCVSFSADGHRVVCGSSDGTIRVWDALSGEEVVQPLIGHTHTVYCVAFSSDRSRVVSGSGDCTLRMWDAVSGEAVGQPLVGHTGHVWCVAFSADGSGVVSGSVDGTVRLWDALSGRAVGDTFPHDGAVTRLAVDEHCSRVVSIEYHSGFGRLWDVRGGACVLTSHHAAWESTINVLALTWSPELEVRRITVRRADGIDVVATCDGSVIRLGERWCTRASGFSEFCEVIRR